MAGLLALAFLLAFTGVTNAEFVLDVTWGRFGTGEGEFNYPYGIAVDPKGYVYVTDPGLHRVQKFTAAGVFVAMWGTPGSGDGQFDNPFGIAADPFGRLYVVDDNRVQKFAADGRFLASWRPDDYFAPSTLRWIRPEVSASPTGRPFGC